MSPRYSYWGGHFPRRGPHSFWDGHFPEPGGTMVLPSIPPEPDQGVVPPSTSAGAGVIELVLSGQVTVSYLWETLINKDRSGRETRIALLDRPNEKYQGEALLVGGDVRRLRALLQRNAASGSAFQLGLPYEELTIIADASGNLITTTPTDVADWTIPGQRALIIRPDGESNDTAPCVIQSASASQIALDISPGDVAISTARIMPTVPVFLDPEQSFSRFTRDEAEDGPAEKFTVVATAVHAGFISAGVPAILPLAEPVTHGSALQGLILVALAGGNQGNSIVVTLSDDALTADGEMDEDVNALTVHFKYVGDETTVDQFLALVGGSSLLGIGGTFTGSDTLASADDTFTDLSPAGGIDGGFSAVGGGASITTYSGRPVYDRSLLVETAAEDMIHALTELIDLGGLPYNPGDTTTPDWQRDALFQSDEQSEFQWFKLFLATVRGRQRAWWMPSWRQDLIPLSIGAGSAAVKAEIPLAAVTTLGTGIFDGLTARAKVAGAAGNNIRFSVLPSGATGTGEYSEDVEYGIVYILFAFIPDVTTVQNMIDLITAESTYIDLIGSFTGSDPIDVTNEFSQAALYGGIDLVGTTLVLDDESPENGDFFAWYPKWDRLQIIQEDETLTYVRILNTETDGSGHVTLHLDTELSDSAVELVSWLELCRFENDQFDVSCKGATKTSSNKARVVQQ